MVIEILQGAEVTLPNLYAPPGANWTYYMH